MMPLNHNIVFLNTFHNTMKEVFHGFPIDQVGPDYYNIPHPSTQGSNQAGTSHQEAAQVGNDDIQVVQSSSKQVQGATANQIQYNPGSSVQHVQQPMGASLGSNDQFLAHQARYHRRLKK